MKRVVFAAALLFATSLRAQEPAVPQGYETRGGAGLAMDADSIADGVRVYALEEVDQAPHPTNIAALRQELERVYPSMLRDVSVKGVVQVAFVVSEQGEVGRAWVTSSSDPRINQATLQAIRVLRFRPGRVNGRAVPTRVLLPIHW
jgi:protein TonB